MRVLDRKFGADYVRVTGGGYRGWVHRGFLPAVPSPGWIATAEPVPGSILKDSRETTVYRLAPPGWGEEVVVKRYNRPGALTPWKDFVRTPRAIGCLLQGAGFLRQGVPTPVPLAAVASRRGGRRSWLVTSVVVGCRALPAILEELAPGDPARKALLEDLADLIRAMHHRRVFHGDLKPVNILARQVGDGREISLVDLDAARIRRRFPRTLAARDIGQLDSYLRREAQAWERRAFFRRYAAGWSRRHRRRFLSAVIRESARREGRRCGG